MFTIKVAYRGQNRRATFQDHNTFPTYTELCSKVSRLFPVAQGFAFSKILFSPDASFSSHNILISKEVRSADDYAKGIRPYKDHKWPSPLLKFVLVDTDGTPRMRSLDSRTPQETSLSGGSCTPLFFSSPLQAMEVDQTPIDATSAQHPEIPLQHKSSMSSFSSCCSVAESKEEIKAMLGDFQVGLNRVLESNLQEPLVVSLQNSQPSGLSCLLENEPQEPFALFPPTAETGSNTTSQNWCSHCTNDIVPTNSGSINMTYSCSGCGVVCKPCFLSNCPNTIHKVVKGPDATIPSRPLPSPWTHPERPRPASFVSPPELRPDESPAVNLDSVVHAGVICDVCNKTIHGVRHKCLDCRDYDLCTWCITTGSAERHNPFHEFYEIREPGRVIVHTVDVSDAQQREFFAPNDGPPAESPHVADCDLCDSGIIGDRYKCAICPDFDTCSSCFTITDIQHPNHSFIKIGKPKDIIRRRSEGRTMHSAICDACNKTIWGDRFKCMHPDCPDYDLCENCEALPIAVHPTNHPMLKMKTASTVIPTVYRIGQHSSINGSRSATPTRSFTGPSSPDTPVGANRAATPTPAMPLKEANVWLSSDNNQSSPIFIPTNPPKVTPMDPFADIFSVDSRRPVPRADTLGMVNQSPTLDRAEREEFRRLIAELSGNTAPPSRSEVNGPKEVSQMTERLTLMDGFFASEVPLHPSNTLPGALPGLIHDEPPAPTQIIAHPTIVPESADTVSDRQPLETILPNVDSQKDDSAELSTVRESLASLVRELPTLVPPPVSPSTEGKITVPRVSLSAAFVEDVTVPDGQVFPPGAEFVKCWRLINDSGCEWPESTELVFLAGDSLPASASVAKGTAVPVGRTSPGETIDVWTGELKAPEVPGRYVGYWRLRAGGELFGNSLWVDIHVVEADSHHSSDESMAASSVIMPAASSAHSDRVPSVITTTLSTQSHSLASEMDDNLSDAGSDMSLISMPSSPSDDEVWHETRSAPPSNLSKTPTAAASSPSAASAAMGMDYVLLYDDESSDEETK